VLLTSLLPHALFQPLCLLHCYHRLSRRHPARLGELRTRPYFVLGFPSLNGNTCRGLRFCRGAAAAPATVVDLLVNLQVGDCILYRTPLIASSVSFCHHHHSTHAHYDAVAVVQHFFHTLHIPRLSRGGFWPQPRNRAGADL
jgi:hypothetical protein